MGISVEWLLIGEDAKEATEEYDVQIQWGGFSMHMRFF